MALVWPKHCAHLGPKDAPYNTLSVRNGHGTAAVGICIFCANRLEMITHAVVTGTRVEPKPDTESEPPKG